MIFSRFTLFFVIQIEETWCSKKETIYLPYRLAPNFLPWTVTFPFSSYQSPSTRMRTLGPSSPRSKATVYGFRPLAAIRHALSAATPLENDNKFRTLLRWCYTGGFTTTIFSATALQCWKNNVTIRNNVATMLKRCIALKNVVAIRPV